MTCRPSGSDPKPGVGADARLAKQSIILTGSQLAAPEKAKEVQEALGEVETEHPGPTWDNTTLQHSDFC